MSRSLSYSEVSAALTCTARHAFAYTGHLTDGTVLKPRTIAPILSDGRAWGAAVAAWHAAPRDAGVFGVWNEGCARFAAHEALRVSYRADLGRQRESGVQVAPELVSIRLEILHEALDHHMSTTERLPNLTRLEGELDVPILARGGRNSSSRYRFHGRVDGYTASSQGQWIVEFKWRPSGLTPVELLQRQAQLRWYGWALGREQAGDYPVGILVDERLGEAPKPPRIVQGGRKGTFRPSHAKDQLCTPDAYRRLCETFGEEPDPETVIALDARRWGQRIPIVFRPGELEEAGAELTSAAKLIRDLDSGELRPIRNASRATCGGCAYREICANPGDRAYVDELFLRGPAKRDRAALGIVNV